MTDTIPIFVPGGEHQKKDAFNRGNDLIETVKGMSTRQRNALRKLLGI